ncbi:hypothetical protein D9M69_709230 [compost metagenome]
MVPLLLLRDQRSAAVELIDDLENRLLPLLGGSSRNEQATDPEMDLSAHCFRDQRIGGFLDTVMNKLVKAL